ncbi:MAG: hypothetical protein KDA17_04765 [Candidatus Saccharibacteria bacterium]|nr:hypothetical protein [Candidatus Saccharibacteria bacterium]
MANYRSIGPVFRIIALDPGGTTGWATYSAFRDPRLRKFDYGQIGPEEHHLELFNFLGLQQVEDTQVVCESFEYRNTSRAGLVLVSKEYIGITKLFCLERDIRYTEQTASMAKAFVKDSHIKKLGLWSSKDNHAMDAMRHLLRYITCGPMKDTSLARQLLNAAWR